MNVPSFWVSLAGEDSSTVLEFRPECIMEEDLDSLSSKFPLIPGSQGSITFCTTRLSEKVSGVLTNFIDFHVELNSNSRCVLLEFNNGRDYNAAMKPNFDFPVLFGWFFGSCMVAFVAQFSQVFASRKLYIELVLEELW